MPDQQTRVPDRRVARTQKLLRDALHSLIHEKAYDSIAVKEILDRANVGRSAFYTHFRDKDELLSSSIHGRLLSLPSAHTKSGGNRDRAERVLGFSLPIFEHLDSHRGAGTRKPGPKEPAILHGHLQRAIAELIVEDVRRALQGRRSGDCHVPFELLTEHIASTFVLVLNWWLESKSPLSPNEVNNVFRALVLPALATVGE
jgi:AcrR family transcriptional regulator